MILQNWSYTSLLPQQYPAIRSLTSNIKADVLIVGGGMTGVSAAAELKGRNLYGTFQLQVSILL